MTTPVLLQQTPQATGNDRVGLTTTGTYNGSKTAWILDAIHKVWRKFVSPQPGYAVSAYLGESQMDFNGKGGLVVGVYGVADGTGTINPQGGVNDVVGMHGTAHKSTNCWAAGVHADVYDYVGGGTAIGVNIEFPLTQPTTNTIGVNVQPNASGKVMGINLQGKVSTALNTADGQTDTLLALNSGSPMWKGNGSPGGALGAYAGKIKIIIDGQTFYLPVYK